MRFDKEKFRQAAQEFAYTFGVFFAIAFCGFAVGWTKLPNLGEVQAAFGAALSSAIVATAKAVLWYFTETKARRGA